jgi:tetratricopeptide (TPR) repeat protein
MILEWFDSREASKVGVALADLFAPSDGPKGANGSALSQESDGGLAGLLEKADLEVRDLRMNFYKRAKLANSFKWRLLEKGVSQSVADDIAQRLALHLSIGRLHAPAQSADPVPSDSASRPRTQKQRLAQGNLHMTRGEYTQAVEYYRDLVNDSPDHAVALNNLGAALSRIGETKEAEAYFYRAVKSNPNYPDAHSNIGNALLLKGQYVAAENYLRHALKLNPRLAEARVNLGLVLSFLGRLSDARGQLEKALKNAPGNADALAGLALVAMWEGNFDQTNLALDSALEANPKMPRALALQARLRRMTQSDAAWQARAEEVAESGIAPLDESELRFAIAKYYDDIGNFKSAFKNYERANKLLKDIADPFDADSYRRFVDDMIRNFTRGAPVAGANGTSDSMKPVFVVGMPRSGTSLVEQIISSHPDARGAGEMGFWAEVVDEHGDLVRSGRLDSSTRTKLAETYLRALTGKTGDAPRLVDKAPINSDYLGIIHSIFPNARIIYMDRDPIDTCLSCYFQRFVLSLNFTMDLSDLANYYRQHRRLMTHWFSVLPPEAIMKVPYEELVKDQEGWSRKILGFLNLEWDERVLDFHRTKRDVVTASFWQVRQRIYKHSVQRWRNYEKYIGPLMHLKRITS